MTTFYAAEGQAGQIDPEILARQDRFNKVWPWVWMGVICFLFASSGVYRFTQDRRFEAAKNRVATALFPLKDLPTEFGDKSFHWKAVKGGEETLDPQIARIAGSTDSLIRVYANEETGVVITLLILYGRAETIVGHTPEVCYPAVGYQMVDDILELTIRPPSQAPARFRGELYARKEMSSDRDEIYYAFRHGDRWTTSVSGNWRVLRDSPDLFKIQIQRKVIEGEQRQLNNPSEQFLSDFIPEFERTLNRATHPQPAQPAAPSPAKAGER